MRRILSTARLVAMTCVAELFCVALGCGGKWDQVRELDGLVSRAWRAPR